MKKLLIIALAITSIVSCKDETETPTPIIPELTVDLRPLASGIFANDISEGDTIILRNDTTTTDKMILSEKRGNQSRVIDILTLIENGPDGIMCKGSGLGDLEIFGHFAKHTDRWTFDVVIDGRRDTYYYSRVN